MHPRQIAVYLTKPAIAVIQHIAAFKQQKPSEIARAAITYWLNHDPEVRQLCLEWDPKPGAFDGRPRKYKVDAAPAPRREDPPLPANTPWKAPVRKADDTEPEVIEPMPPWVPSEITADEQVEQRQALLAAEEKRLQAQAQLDAKRVRRSARFAATQARRAEKKAAKSEPEREIPVSNAKLMPQFGGPALPEGCRQTQLDEAIAPSVRIEEKKDTLPTPDPVALPNRIGRTWRWKPPVKEPFNGF